MDRQWETRLEGMLAECEVSPRLWRNSEERLRQFVAPFTALLSQQAQRKRAVEYVAGLVTDVKRKNVESIAYRHDQERGRLQHFIGCAQWDHQPLLNELARQVGAEVGEADGVIVFDPSGFPKQGKKSVGVARQWCGRLGKVENCQVAVYMAYVSRKEHVLVNERLYLPQEWTSERKRCKAAGVPQDVRFKTRHRLALDMLTEQGHALPHRWVAGDDEMGKNAMFRRDLHEQGEQYSLAVPSNTLIRDLEAAPPEYQGRGTKPKQPFQRVDRWRDALPARAWTRVDVRDGEKGPLEVDVAVCRVVSRFAQRRMPYEETLVIVRSRDGANVTKYDFYLSDAPSTTPKHEFARVALAAHRIEEAIKRGKSETGLSHYEVRNWLGWHHHQALSLLATWFLTCETRLGKKIDTGHYVTPAPPRHRQTPPRCLAVRHTAQDRRLHNASLDPQRASAALSLQGM